MATYFISGVRTGIGLEYVRQLSLLESTTVIGTVRSLSNSAGLEALHSVLKRPEVKAQVHLVECDLSSTESINSLASRLPAGLQGKIDIVIQNAAILQPICQQESSLNVTAKSLVDHFTTNAIGPALLVQSLLPYLAPNAKIANITSGVGSKAMLSDGRIPASITAYSISKAALNMLTVHQAQDLKDQATVVCIDPGHVKTEMGGPNAKLEIPDSARGVLKVIGELTKEHNGRFLLYNGAGLEW
ncbi:hypothetical protein S40293_05732 [Stachybotrys chartarum IBT 40293]|nr:hypothetical protein S40293_05732 [Stachybotrys chartarum IBT 40293]